MAVFIDPKTGERFANVPDDQAALAQSEFGLVTPEQYAAQEEGALVAAGRAVAKTVLAPAQVAAGAVSQARPDLIAPELVEAQKPFYERAAASAEAFPVTSAVAGAIPELALGVATGGAGVGVGRAAIGLAGESALSGGLSEAISASTEGRAFSATEAAEKALAALAFGTAAFGGGKLISSAFSNAGKPAGARALVRGERSSLQRAAESAAQAKSTRAAAAEGEELVDSLADPEVARELASTLRKQADELLLQADTAVGALRPPKIATNSNAQRAALSDLADAFEKGNPDVAKELQRLRTSTNPRGRFAGLQDLRDAAEEGSDLAEALDKALTRGDLWGDSALAQMADIDATKALRPAAGAAPQAWREYADQLRRLPGMDVKATAIEELAERADQVKLAATLRPTKSVGARGGGPDLISADEVQEFVRKDDDIVDAMRLSAGEDFPKFNDSFRAAMNNRVKRADFEAAAPTDPTVRAALNTERGQIADSLHEVTRALGARGAKRPVSLLNAHIKQLRVSPLERVPAMLDRIKQTLDNLHMKAVVDKTDPYGEVISAVDPVVERIRGALQNPDYVGATISELQQVRNAAWADKATGFIRNTERARAAGADFFKKIDVDYDTGDLVFEFDPRAFRSFLELDVHDAKPGMEAWANILDSVERMTANKLEAGVASAKSMPPELLESIGGLRAIFETQAKRVYVKNLRRGSDEAVTRAEQFPIVGKVVTGAKALLGRENIAAAAASARQKYVPAQRQSVDEARALLRKLGGTGLGAAAVFAALGVNEASAADETVALAKDIQEAAQVDQRTTARLLVNPEQAAKLARLRGRPDSAMTRFQGDHETLRQAFQAARDLVEGFAKSPMALLDLLAEEFGDLADASPELHRQVASQAIKISQYLQATLPGQRNVSVVYPKGTPASPHEIRQYALRFQSAVDPESVKVDARAGKLRQEQVDTLKALWPTEYDGLRAGVLEELGKGGSSTTSRQLMNLRFGFGGSVDPALGPRVSALVAAAREKADQAAPTPKARGMRSASPPSKANLMPGGLSALSLGASLDQQG